MAYIKTTWENEPSESTPLNASNLNKIEQGIYDNSVVSDTVGDANNLKTTSKTTLVDAINELKDGEIYSINEVKTNKTWINNKPIYRKVLTGKFGSTDNWNNIYTGDFENITSIFGYFQASNEFYTIPRSYNNQEIALYWRNNGNLYEMHNYDYCNNRDYTIVLEYTKTN